MNPPFIRSLWVLVLSLHLLLFCGAEESLGVKWNARIYDANRDYIVVVVETNVRVQDISFTVAFFDSRGREVDTLEFAFTADELPELGPGTHRKFFEHGLEDVKSARGEKLSYVVVRTIAFMPAPGYGSPPAPPPPQLISREASPTDADLWDESGTTHGEVP